MSAYERSGWRDMELSGRHRIWGFNCPAVDLDFLMVEYNLGIAIAVVEYKHYLAPPQNFKHPTYRALGGLYVPSATGFEQLPLLIARYWPENWSFAALPVNESARAWLAQGRWTPMTERQFVESLYKMRELAIDQRILQNLNNQLPPSVTDEGW
jgi:hypothetical protein